MKRTLSYRALFLAVALLTLASQAAVACHSPAHEEETVSKCTDGSKHFCAEAPSEEGGRCLLCQVSTGGIALTLSPSTDSFVIAETFAVVDFAGPRSALKFSPASPRAPPSLPA